MGHKSSLWLCRDAIRPSAFRASALSGVPTRICHVRAVLHSLESGAPEHLQITFFSLKCLNCFEWSLSAQNRRMASHVYETSKSRKCVKCTRIFWLRETMMRTGPDCRRLLGCIPTCTLALMKDVCALCICCLRQQNVIAPLINLFFF